MEALSTNNHLFIQKAKQSESDIQNSAIKKANELHKEKKNIRVFSVSQEICDDAYKAFTESVKSMSNDKDLITLTIMAREKSFLIELNEKIRRILRSSAEKT